MVEAKGVYFSYTGSPPYVLNGIDLDIQSGEYVSVVGENGSGKSTLIRLVLGFLRPTAGAVSTRARRIGYVPQKSDAGGGAFPITVGEALHSYRKLLKIREKDAVARLLRQVGMEGTENALMGTLSGGQAQKILIARALLGSPELLILDEPSTGVDAPSQREIYGFLKGCNAEKGITILSVEHNLDAAIANSTLIYHLARGQGHLCTPKRYAEEFLKEKR